MKALIGKLLIGGLLGVSALALWPSTGRADPDDYWVRHWRWYDRAYRPYYHRRYYYSPPPAYAYPPASPYTYSSPYYSAPYYGGTTTYYGPAPAPYYGGGVVVGPLRFGWW